MKIENVITKQVVDIPNSQASNWLSSCTPWIAEDPQIQLKLNRKSDANDLMHVDFENCYGIRRLNYSFDFKDGKPYSIYAPNGFMKTSFAKTLNDIQMNRNTSDEVYPDRINKRNVIANDGKSINPESVYVIPPYQEGYDSEGSSMLLVNSVLKKEYELEVIKIEKDLKAIEVALNKLYGKRNSLNELKSVFNVDDSELYEFISSMINLPDSRSNYEDLPYGVVFDDKVEKLLMEGSIQDEISQYLDQYHELVDDSPILSREFSHLSAGLASNSLESSGYFKANHSLNISTGKDSITVKTKEEFEKIIDSEKNKIILDPKLEKIFSKLDKKLNANVSLRSFREYLLDNKEVISELKDFNGFKRNVWLGFFKKEESLFENYSENYRMSVARIKEIVEKASLEKTKWEAVVDIFNERFHVPFKLKVENQNGVILKSEEPVINFEFNDGFQSVNIEKIRLLNILSLGEKRALYILNILFDINARRESDINTIFIVDDIADSFDYKNKYAIIEYFKELSETKDFNFIFLTHNFDFHRTICSRLNIPSEKGLFTVKYLNKIVLDTDRYQGSPFLRWKENLSDDDFAVIACIPFVRNLCEFTSGYVENYKKLTSLLHVREETESITTGSLELIYKKELGSEVRLNNTDRFVIDVIIELANKVCARDHASIDLEEKVVLSIAIRLLAEKYMIKMIDDRDFLNSIRKNQTMELFRKFIKIFPCQTRDHALLTQVNLMTPENIHLNSFMYEPILDMSSKHLCDLYQKVSRL